ncbi:BOS complex subunit NOMO3-like [Oppia nitens]|uniref:BOS complex subunit NOMO3-like n=1 Tax=Oppia nitens TaxID=1686743 RepID=UPI0023DBC701|nr:BOS complex subunit NOMO3-like [Oppia nitens]
MSAILLIITIAIQIFGTTFGDNDVIGCGGFVKSIVNINYNNVFIKLLTDKGIVKYTTDCAPNNGYYFIPLYDKGLYELKIEPPKGWTFEPMSVELNFDGKTDICSQQNDINFSFKGFTVSGNVLSDGSTTGPEDISTTLKAKLNNNILKTTKTTSNGFYEFKEVLPGDYIIEATHPTLKLKKNQIEVSVTNDNVYLPANSANSLSVLGYEVTGNVMSDGEPIHSVLFALFSQKRHSILGCDTKQIPIKSSSNDLIYLCHTSSDKNGVFRFPTVSFGSYVLIPFYGGNNVMFDVKPKELKFEVKNQNVKIETLFEIEGFSVSGRIVVDQKGVPNAKVIVKDQTNGNEQTVITKTDGRYNLENIKTGNYEILVTSPHMTFNPTLLKISPIASQIPDISPNAFDVCGTFTLKSTPTNRVVNIEFKGNKHSESIIEILDEEFCVLLRPDTYTISPIASDPNFKLIPSQMTITVKSDPILDLKFLQFTASISGLINTLHLTNDLQLKLFNKIDNHLLKTLKFSDLRKISNNKFEFKFEDLSPGIYQIVISKSTDSWCWQTDTHTTEVIDKNIEGLEFNQKGYLLSLYFSHIIDFDLKYPSNKVEKLRIGSDRTLRHCVTESGIYSIIPKGCHKFSDSSTEVISFDTTKDSGNLISKTATKHLMTADVITNLNVSDIVLTVKMKSFGNEEYTQRLHLVQHKSYIENNEQLFQYLISIWTKPMVNIYLEPTSSQLLFKPNSFEVKLEDNCVENSVTFKGKIGLIINGQIFPKLEGVVIKIVSSDQLLFTTKTDSLGKYIAGAFDSDISLTVSAEKEGYFFKSVANKLGHFEAIRLSKILVEVKDEKNEPLSDVLISISGGTDNYRKNSVTPTNGQLVFQDLHSGQYFLRVMKKEYDFEPSSQMLTVDDGSDIKAEISAKQVAFSCIGITDSLNGEPESGVIVEAIGLRNIVTNSQVNCSQLQEETISEPNGSFRVRGLRPECQYAIRIKANDDRNKNFNQSIPRIHLIRVEDRDITNVRLIIFRKITQMDVSGDVITAFEHLPSLKIRLYSELNPDQPITTIALNKSPFFFLPPLNIDNRNYFIRLESSLSSNIYELDTPLRTFRANTSHIHLTITFNPRLKSNDNSNYFIDQDISHGSIYTLPLILIITIAVYNYSKIYPFIIQMSNNFNRLNAERTLDTDINSFFVKKKTKSKKI